MLRMTRIKSKKVIVNHIEAIKKKRAKNVPIFWIIESVRPVLSK